MNIKPNNALTTILDYYEKEGRIPYMTKEQTNKTMANIQEQMQKAKREADRRNEIYMRKLSGSYQ